MGGQCCRAWVLVGLGMLACAIPGCPGLEPGSDFSAWPLDAAGYTIETLPFPLAASFARGQDVYLGTTDGRILRVRDDDLGQPESMPGPGGSLRGLFVTRTGAVLACVEGGPVWRSADGGATWQVSRDTPGWRIDEDDQGNLYAGNYTKDAGRHASLFKSTDDGQSWQEVWTDPDNDHVHTVRWDPRGGRLYFAFGDGDRRGQGYTDDRGRTFTILRRGTQEGHTDAACSLDYVFWASDDGDGRIIRVSRQSGRGRTLTGNSQFMWFAVAGDYQVYVGTVTSQRWGGDRAALLASADQGETWQKLLETDVSSGPYDQGFSAESRNLSANGWLYCANQRGPAYRIRRDIVTAR